MLNCRQSFFFILQFKILNQFTLAYFANKPMLIEKRQGLSLFSNFLLQTVKAEQRQGAALDADSIAVIRQMKKDKQLANVTCIRTAAGKIIASEHAGSYQQLFDEAPNNSIAVVPQIGTMYTEDGLCTYGIDHFCNRMDAAAASSNILGIVVRSHSGGGEVTAAQRAHNAVAAANAVKPVVQLIDGTSASGSVMLGAAAAERIAAGTTTDTGSIGVVLSIPDWWIEEMKEGITTIYASTSPNKHQLAKDLMEGKLEAIQSRELDPLHAAFKSMVKAGMPAVKDEALTGHMYFAPDALRLGLVDHIADMNFAMNRVSNLTSDKKLNITRQVLAEKF